MVFDGLFLCLGIYGNEICFFFFYCKKWQLSRLIKRGLSFSSRWSWSASFFLFFSCTSLTLISSGLWKMPCISWKDGHLLCDQVASVSGHLPHGGKYLVTRSQACEIPGLPPSNQTLPPYCIAWVSQVPWMVGVGWAGRSRFLSLWHCSPSNKWLPDLHYVACHWD